MKNRNDHIDALRGIGIFFMILIHVTAWYRSDAIAAFFWNYAQFAVQIFVFCSGYVFYLKDKTQFSGLSLQFLWRRATRLLIPYYAFLLVYLPLEFIEDARRISAAYVAKSLSLTGGPDLNWAVLLFLYMALVTPVLMYFKKSRPVIFWIYLGLSIVLSALFLDFKIENYKLIMWLPWSLLLPFSWLIADDSGRRKWLVPTIAATLASTLGYLQKTGGSLLFFDNKYPPNAYYLSYGMIWILALWEILRRTTSMNILKRFFVYFGIHSYELFFIHFWVFICLRLLHIWLPWSLQFVLLLMISVLLQKTVSRFTASQH